MQSTVDSEKEAFAGRKIMYTYGFIQDTDMDSKVQGVWKDFLNFWEFCSISILPYIVRYLFVVRI